MGFAWAHAQTPRASHIKHNAAVAGTRARSAGRSGCPTFISAHLALCWHSETFAFQYFSNFSSKTLGTHSRAHRPRRHQAAPRRRDGVPPRVLRSPRAGAQSTPRDAGDAPVIGRQLARHRCTAAAGDGTPSLVTAASLRVVPAARGARFSATGDRLGRAQTRASALPAGCARAAACFNLKTQQHRRPRMQRRPCPQRRGSAFFASPHTPPARVLSAFFSCSCSWSLVRLLEPARVRG